MYAKKAYSTMGAAARIQHAREEKAKILAPLLASQLSDFDKQEILAGRFTPHVISIADREEVSRGALYAALVIQLSQEHV